MGAQRPVSTALNLNIHFHMLFLDGVYVGEANSSAQFRWVKAPTSVELTQLIHTISESGLIPVRVITKATDKKIREHLDTLWD